MQYDRDSRCVRGLSTGALTPIDHKFLCTIFLNGQLPIDFAHASERRDLGVPCG